MDWKALIFKLLEACLGTITSREEMAKALNESRPGVRRRFARRVRLSMLLEGATLADARDVSELIMSGEWEPEEIDEVYAAYQQAKG